MNVTYFELSAVHLISDGAFHIQNDVPVSCVFIFAVYAVSAKVLGGRGNSALPQDQDGERQLSPGGESYDANPGKKLWVACIFFGILSMFTLHSFLVCHYSTVWSIDLRPR